MSLFTKSEASKREPTVEQARAARESELLEEIRALDSQVEKLRSLIAVFKSEHVAIVGGQTVFATSDLHGRDELAEQWNGLCAEAARLAQERNAALSAWSELHSNPGEVSHHAG